MFFRGTAVMNCVLKGIVYIEMKKVVNLIWICDIVLTLIFHFSTWSEKYLFNLGSLHVINNANVPSIILFTSNLKWPVTFPDWKSIFSCDVISNILGTGFVCLMRPEYCSYRMDWVGAFVMMYLGIMFVIALGPKWHFDVGQIWCCCQSRAQH